MCIIHEQQEEHKERDGTEIQAKIKEIQKFRQSSPLLLLLLLPSVQDQPTSESPRSILNTDPLLIRSLFEKRPETKE